MSDLEQRHDWNTGANDLTVQCHNCHKPLIPNTSAYPDWQSIDWREHWKDQPCVPNYFARIAELETQNKKLLEVAELSSIRFTDQLTALQDQLAEANKTIDATLGIIDQTIYANEDSLPSVNWRNSEVLEMLHLIRKPLITEYRKKATSDRDRRIEEIAKEAHKSIDSERAKVIKYLATPKRDVE